LSAYHLPTSFDSKLFTITLHQNSSSLEHAHRDIEFIFMIQGQLRVSVNHKAYRLNDSDFLLINSHDFHSFHSDGDNLFVVLHIDFDELRSLFAHKNIHFACNSTEQVDSSHHELRAAIEQFLTVFLKRNNASKSEVFEKAFKIIACLEVQDSDDHPLPEAQGSWSDNERLNRIVQYMHNRFREPLSLDEVAQVHHLSVPYLSKYFKKRTGKTFFKYLTEFRLAHAVQELLTTPKPVTRIALDNGFPNLSSFNRVFHERYQQNPAAYRKQNAVFANKGENCPKEILSEAAATLEKETIKIGPTVPIMKFWNNVINVGYAKDILSSDLQEQIVLLQHDIGFTHARLWGLFGEDMLVEDHVGGMTTYNFTHINKVLDFLTRQQLKPFIELGPKPKIISKQRDCSIVIQHSKDRNIEEWTNLYKAFLLHCIERYGIEEVEKWYFELWSKRIDPFFDEDQQESAEPNPFDAYLRLFGALKRIAKELVPAAKFGGCGISMELEVDRLDDLLQQWKREEHKPDFLSVYVYPIEIDEEKQRFPIRNVQSANHQYERIKLSQISRCLKKAGFEGLELNVTEWNLSPFNRDYLHDSCFKAAYLVKMITDLLNRDQPNMLGYWQCSDLFSEDRDAKQLLHGGTGLMTKNGIKKPSYHAYMLLNQLGDQWVAQGQHFVVTKKSGDRYQVLCFNYKHFRYAFYFQPEGSFGFREQNRMFENMDVLRLSLEIQGIPNGKYRVKEKRLNRDQGSILDEWLNFGPVDDWKPDEIQYLKQICVPRMKVEHTVVDNRSIVLKGELEPHEVRLFEIQLLYGG